MKKKVISIILIFLMLQAYIYSVIAATESELNGQRSDLQQKVNNAKEEQAQLQEELDEEMKAISNLDYEISQVQAEVDELNAKISELETSISEKEKLIEEKQKEYDKNQDLLAQRIVVMYETGDTSFLDMLFSSASLVDFISNYYTMQQLVQFDAELLQSIEDDRKAVEEAKKELENEKAEVEELKSEKVSKMDKLKAKQAERQSKANELSGEKKALQNEIDKYNAEIKKVDQQIAAIWAQANSQVNGSGLQFDGSFIWPCTNKIITSTVKQRWGRWHKGIDIGARYEDVYASASGYAYTLNNPGGYGLYILIVHGSGYCTLYGHLNAYKISSGQYVRQGQVIAQSGNTGSSTGPHLHFEVRRASSLSNYFSSSFLNPLDYLPGGYTFAAGASTPS